MLTQFICVQYSYQIGHFNYFADEFRSMEDPQPGFGTWDGNGNLVLQVQNSVKSHQSIIINLCVLCFDVRFKAENSNLV
jgi:hypothetical protein